MNAAFFGLAAYSALNPKLLILDLILVTNRRPAQMFLCFLIGGIGLNLTIGLLDVFVLHLDAIKTQNHSSGALDLALGIPLLAIGALLATNHLHLRRRHRPPPEKKPPSKLQSWVARTLHEPHYGLAVLIGAVVGTPGVPYLLALHHLVITKTPAALAVVAVIVFVLINFSLVIIPFWLVLARPEGTVDKIKRFKAWIVSHERQIAATVALLAGGYMVVSGTLRVLS